MKTREEYDQASFDANAVMAVKLVEIENELDRKYPIPVYLGTDKAKGEALKQYEEAKAKAAEKMIQNAYKMVEASFFGPGGRDAAMKLVEAEEAKTSDAKSVIEIPQAAPQKLLPGIFSKIKKLI
ncbi:MAG: hypothetical protein R2824_24105 [Saprospiraceae bacterium]|nr:hypothetical protein [Lewinella sp.]